MFAPFRIVFIIFCIGLAIHVTNQSNLDFNNCIAPGQTVQCSGRGNCEHYGGQYKHGICNCHVRKRQDQVYSGNYCECDNFTCDHYNGEPCSGSHYGTCRCGQCVCAEGRTGSACECSTATTNCFARTFRGINNSELCSGHGECTCNKCSCFEGFFGPHCFQTINEDFITQ